ncbi:hypothetical protein [Prevotella sp. HJM029]|uniref:hypothetical protein n=1 Tax=Prevotella sp. HJM029 TaxID=1433844 RepID=UPI0004B640A0|nr:hypothetical protein [Prevotella sp. HJM029]
MKKINRLTLVLTLMAAGLFAGCASDEEATRENQKIALDGSHFKFTEVAYQADQAVTRAAASVKPTTVDLGDGLEAEVSVTPDAPTGKTRAVDPISDGKYTILAFDPSTHNLQGKLEGSVTGGVFAPDAGQKLLLDPGTYDFTCFSEPVEYDEPNKRLVVKNWLTKSPTIGHVQETIAGDDYEVAFNMEHKAARVRLNITSDILSENTPIDAYLQGTTFLTGYWMQDWHTAYSGALDNTGNFFYNVPQPLTFTNIAPVTTQAGTTCTSAYGYMLPSTESNNSLKDYTLHFTAGTIGGGSLASKAINLSGATFPTGFQWDYNQSITINVNVKGQLYLFEDGKARVYAGRGTHTPIGLVIQQKWEPTNQKGTACALEIIKDPVFPNPVTHGDAYAWEDETKTLPSNPDHLNTTVYNGVHDGQNDMNGYNWTWDANSTKDHVVRGDAKEKYPAFYQAGHYTPSNATITGANIGKWYIPAAGEVMELFRLFGTITVPANEPWRGNCNMAQTDIDKMLAAFTKVNSGLLLKYQFLWTSTVCDAANTGGFGPYTPVSFYINGSSSGQIWWPTFNKVGANFYILPFVKY